MKATNPTEAKTLKPSVGLQPQVMWRVTGSQSGSLTVSKFASMRANYWIKYPRTQNDEAGRRATANALAAWLNGGERGPELEVLFRDGPDTVQLQSGHRITAGWGDEIDRGLLIDAICDDKRPD